MKEKDQSGVGMKEGTQLGDSILAGDRTGRRRMKMDKLTVTVTDKFKVEIDDNNHTLLEWVEPTLITVGKYKGNLSEGKWSVIGYYSGMSGALYRLATVEGWQDRKDGIDLVKYCTETLDKAKVLLKSIDT